MTEPIFQPLGDQGLLMRFGWEIRPDINQAIRRFCLTLERKPIPGVVEWVPAYTTVAIYYRPQEIGFDTLREALGKRIGSPLHQRLPAARTVAIPTLYGGEYGPDLEEVAAIHGLSSAKVIALHSEPSYLIYMLGFAPGFPYLGGLPESLATPRLAAPRLQAPAGAVAIGGSQTGIYPLAMPGGWRLIGRTPLTLFDPYRQPPALLRPGDHLKFVPITETEYEALARQGHGHVPH